MELTLELPDDRREADEPARDLEKLRKIDVR